MLKIRYADLRKARPEVLILPVCREATLHTDDFLAGLVEKALRYESFQGKSGEHFVFFETPGLTATTTLLFGMGKRSKLNPESFRAIAGKAIQQCMKMRSSQAAFAVPDDPDMPLETGDALRALMEGACLGNHVFNRYKEKKKHTALRSIAFFTSREVAGRHVALAGEIASVCESVKRAREWVSMPANEKRPEMLAKTFAAAARKAGVRVEILDEKALKRKKFGALLAVSAGSGSRPRVVVMDHRPKGARRTILLVGKGVTFDSGGINLKPGNSLDGMKADMSGAAAVAGAVTAAAAHKTKHRVIGVLPLVENMISGDATRPGDIVTTYSGKTVEIGNTDAEGRLILADALAWAIDRYHPQITIDLATLTGACLVALGTKFAAVFSEDDALAAAVVAAGARTHERCWRMPLPEDYRELLKSDFADISNMPSSRWGGAITAALFLSEFAKNTRWAHIDIAGPAYAKKASAYCGPGGTGFGVRLLCDLLERELPE